MHYFSSSRCMPIFILVRKLVLLVCITSALIMSFSARTINKIPLKYINVQSNHDLLRAETLGQNLKIRNRKLELGLYTCYVYFI